MATLSPLLDKTLSIILQANSIGAIETGLTQNVAAELELASFRIVLYGHATILERLQSQSNVAILKVPLKIHPAQAAWLIAIGFNAEPIVKKTERFLNILAEPLAAAVRRLVAIDQLEVVKQQWEMTFDSISEPICLTNENNLILRTNRAFSTKVHKTYSELLGKNGFIEFFGDTTDLSEATPPFRTKASRLTPASHEFFEVSGQSIDARMRLMFFRDITNQHTLERQVLESNKMAELGVIGSSIAHELNNPIAGIISFLQLIRMGMAKDHSLFTDIKEMEEAAHRCKNIVENLLGFSRKHDLSENTEIQLNRAIEKAFHILELKTKSKGIHVDLVLPPEPVLIHGNVNLLAQALQNILQNALEAVDSRYENDPRFDGQIRIELKSLDDHALVIISDNGPGIDPQVQGKIFNPLFSTKKSGIQSGLGLTVAYQIIREHHGNLEIFSQPNIGTAAKISFKRLDLQVVSQVFDSKI